MNHTASWGLHPNSDDPRSIDRGERDVLKKRYPVLASHSWPRGEAAHEKGRQGRSNKRGGRGRELQQLQLSQSRNKSLPGEVIGVELRKRHT